MNNKTKKYGLIGKSLAHSFSKGYFTQKFADDRIDAIYENISLSKIEAVRPVLLEDYAGCNVTIPYKEAIIPFIDELHGAAEIIQAVNTIEFKNGKTIGHNTDVFGFKQMIKPFLNFFINNHFKFFIITIKKVWFMFGYRQQASFKNNFRI